MVLLEISLKPTSTDLSDEVSSHWCSLVEDKAPRPFETSQTTETSALAVFHSVDEKRRFVSP